MIDLMPLMRLGLMFVRPGMLIAASPAFGGAFAPARVKVGLIVLVSIAMLPMAPRYAPAEPLPIALLVAREMAIGFAMALALHALVAGVEFGGHLAGFQMGMSYGATVDPQSGVRNPLMAVLFNNIAMMTFFAVDGHHTFLRVLGQSYVDLPMGAGGVSATVPQEVAHLLGTIFTLGARLGAPVVIVVLVAELGLALMARTAPALNPMGVGAPVRTIVGLLVLMVMVPSVASIAAASVTTIAQMAAHAAQAFR